MNAVRHEHIDGLGEVRILKKRGVRRISLRLHSSGQVRISQPYYLPFSAGLLFAKSHAAWIAQQRMHHRPLQLYDGMQIGKSFILRTYSSNALRTRLYSNELSVYTPNTSLMNLTLGDITLIKKAIKRAINKEAKHIVPIRVQELSTSTGLSYRSIIVKPLKSRWGSCSSKQELTFNCYLTMLPNECIDYVIIHELVHTIHMNHSKDFWAEVERILPTYKQIKKQLKQLQASVHAFYV